MEEGKDRTVKRRTVNLSGRRRDWRGRKEGTQGDWKWWSGRGQQAGKRIRAGGWLAGSLKRYTRHGGGGGRYYLLT